MGVASSFPAMASLMAAPAPRTPAGDANARLQRLWIDEGGKARPVDVEVGATDGSVTEIVKGPLRVGQRVIVDLVSDEPVRR